MANQKNPMTTQEAGRMGGQSTSRKYGKEFYQQIGKMGGTTVRDMYGPEFYQQIGKKGGGTVRRLIEEAKNK